YHWWVRPFDEEGRGLKPNQCQGTFGHSLVRPFDEEGRGLKQYECNNRDRGVRFALSMRKGVMKLIGSMIYRMME
ncbi:MAG TPA: hypothetical protein VFZ34_26855, partial [Blastocatellia bacterium]|nr:hypothetical protein [Blastocatellia bacterium]